MSIAPRHWATVTALLTVTVVVAGVAVEVADDDFLPPRVSVSQYGVGSAGWLFTIWSMAVGAAALTGYAASCGRDRRIWALLALGAAGALVMGVIRTDADGLQHSWHARVHLIGSVLALVALPVGCWSWLVRRPTSIARISTSALLGSAVALVLLLLAAAGHDTLGAGASAAWAFWQSVAVLLDIAQLVLVAVAARTATVAAAAGSGRPRFSMW